MSKIPYSYKTHEYVFDLPSNIYRLFILLQMNNNDTLSKAMAVPKSHGDMGPYKVDHAVVFYTPVN